MHLRSLARDCLYLNWALPYELAPRLPLPLRYEIHHAGGEAYVFVSALLFRLSGMHLQALPFLRVGYPQMSVRLYVLDGSDTPSLLFLRVLVPPWVLPATRLFGRQATGTARFDFPASPLEPDDGGWRWTVEKGRRLELAASVGLPALGPGPRLGSFDDTVEHFRRRERAYALRGKRLRSINSSRPAVTVWPLDVEIDDVGLVSECMRPEAEAAWPAIHSAWVSPEIPFTFELGRMLEVKVPRRAVPAAEGC